MKTLVVIRIFVEIVEIRVSCFYTRLCVQADMQTGITQDLHTNYQTYILKCIILTTELYTLVARGRKHKNLSIVGSIVIQAFFNRRVGNYGHQLRSR